MAHIVLATSLLWPEPTSDAPLREALAVSDHTSVCVPWNSADQSAFQSADLILLRSCWDYHKAPDAFLAWLDSLAPERVRNPLALVRWNFDKSYLVQLRKAGFNVPETKLVDPKDHGTLRRIMQKEGWQRAVRKPLSGQSGKFVDVLDLAEYDAWPDSVMPTKQALLQEFEKDVERLGETLLYFFRGRFEYAVQRLPAPRNGQSRVEVSVSAKVIEQAREVLAFVGHPPLYARIDGLVRDDTFLLMELELIEPSFAFDVAPHKAADFVREIEEDLRQLGHA